jgi:hypothetical protein
VNNGLPYDEDEVFSLSISGNNIFAGTFNGVYLSTNNGSNWTAVNNGLPKTFVYSIAISGSNIFIGTSGSGVFLSTNNGGSWTAVNNGITGYGLNVMSITVNGSNIFAATAAGVYLSTDNGGTWTAFNSGLKGGGLFVASLAVKGDYILAGTYGGAWRRPLSEVLILNVSTNSISLDAPDNSTSTFDLISNINWTVSSSEPWLTVSNTSGYRDATITLTAQAITITTPRTAIVTVSGSGLPDKTVTVTQNGISTGINETENENDFIKIYPNPANHTLSVEGLKHKTKVSIYDLNGQLLFNEQLNENRIDISNFKNGIYTIIFEDKKRTTIKRFIKK